MTALVRSASLTMSANASRTSLQVVSSGRQEAQTCVGIVDDGGQRLVHLVRSDAVTSPSVVTRATCASCGLRLAQRLRGAPFSGEIMADHERRLHPLRVGAQGRAGPRHVPPPEAYRRTNPA